MLHVKLDIVEIHCQRATDSFPGNDRDEVYALYSSDSDPNGVEWGRKPGHDSYWGFKDGYSKGPFRIWEGNLKPGECVGSSIAVAEQDNAQSGTIAAVAATAASLLATGIGSAVSTRSISELTGPVLASATADVTNFLSKLMVDIAREGDNPIGTFYADALNENDNIVTTFIAGAQATKLRERRNTATFQCYAVDDGLYVVKLRVTAIPIDHPIFGYRR